MKFTRHYFIDGQYLGSGPAPVHWHHNEQCAPLGQAYFCPICAEIWANLPVDGQPSTVRHRFCIKHALGERYGESSMGSVSPFEVLGSILLDEDATFNANLPPAVVEREFAVHMRYAISRFAGGIASDAAAIYNSLNRR